LADRANNRCSFPECNIGTSSASEESSSGVVSIGVAAHIYAAAPNGPRFEEKMTAQERSGIENGIWLCATHSVMVDRDRVRYTPEVLIDMRQAHEQAIAAEQRGEKGTQATRTTIGKIRGERLSNLAPGKVEGFVGRSTELQDLYTFLRSHARHVIWGEPGVGKSQLARQWAYYSSEQYLLRWWINAADAASLRSGLRELAASVGIEAARLIGGSVDDGGTNEARFLSELAQVLSHPAMGGRVLIVLDNVDGGQVKSAIGELALRYLPVSSCDVLITSQSGQWAPSLDSLKQLKGLDTSSSLALLEATSQRLGLTSKPQALRISELLGARPLFLKFVGHLLREIEPDQFIELFQQQPEVVLDSLPPGEDIFTPAWQRIYGVALDRLQLALGGSADVMRALAFLGHEPVPLETAVLIARQALGVSRTQALARIRVLQTRGWIEQDFLAAVGESALSVHGAVSAVVRLLATNQGLFSQALEACTCALESSLPSIVDVRQPAGISTMTPLAPHVQSVCERVLREANSRTWALSNGPELTVRPECIALTSSMASILALHRRTLSRWKDAQDTCVLALSLATLTGKPAETALRQVQLANILRQRGEFENAQSRLDDSVAILSAHGSAADYAWALTVKARVLRHRPKSDPQEALATLHEAMAVVNKQVAVGAVTRQQVSELHGYLSVVYRQLSRIDDAEFEAERGIAALVPGGSSSTVLAQGAANHEVLVAMHLRALGAVWRLRGQFEQAARAHKVALEMFERVYGTNHSDYYRSLDSLARVQREWGDLDEALTSFERAELIIRRQFGPGHAHVGTVAVNKALVQMELGYPEQALLEAERGLAIYKQAYQELEDDTQLKNDSTVWALFVRADAFAACGKPQKALIDHSTVLLWRLKAFRQAHAHQASSYYAIAEGTLVLGHQDALDKAIHNHRLAHAIRLEVFGTQPNYWLALSEARLGELLGDRVTLARAHDYFRANLKPGHWRTMRAGQALQLLMEKAP
jgi:tetratricopeptide (TPR) repeat protein